MRFCLQQSFAEPLEAVEATLTDPEFLASLAALPNVGNATLLDQRVEGHLLHQRVRYAFTGELGPAVTRFVDPAKLTWVEASTLDRRAHVREFRIVPDHYGNRLTCEGRSRLAAVGGGSRRTTEGDLRVHLPLVGRKAEQAIVSGLADHARAEEAAVAGWLRARA